jgi:hypothetical protein
MAHLHPVHDFYCQGCKRWDSKPYARCTSCKGWLRRRWLRIGGALLLITLINVLLLSHLVKKKHEQPPEQFTKTELAKLGQLR